MSTQMFFLQMLTLWTTTQRCVGYRRTVFYPRRIFPTEYRVLECVQFWYPQPPTDGGL